MSVLLLLFFFKQKIVFEASFLYLKIINSTHSVHSKNLLYCNKTTATNYNNNNYYYYDYRMMKMMMMTMEEELVELGSRYQKTSLRGKAGCRDETPRIISRTNALVRRRRNPPSRRPRKSAVS